MADARFLFVTIDCADPVGLASFWSALLDTPVGEAMDDGRFVFLEGRDDLPTICFQRVPEPKTVKNRLHLDLSVDDLEAATARIVELGGSWGGAEHTLENFTWRNVADPEGNEFDIAVG
ncbi:MAG TPA: VOC family protein [Actinomycetota bacterium]